MSRDLQEIAKHAGKELTLKPLPACLPTRFAL
jgi:hypothetical protein